MAFIVKDLMISVLQSGGLNVGGFGGMASTDHCTGPCCLVECSHPSCAHNSCVTTLGGFDPNAVINPPDLAALKQRLKIAMAQVEAREAVVKQEMVPKTVEEVEVLEKHMRSALDELKKIKDQIGQKKSAD